jgi:hypothetical protein
MATVNNDNKKMFVVDVEASVNVHHATATIEVCQP